jgi:3-hydroxyisobutyrate dehydrogenase-like beta-hydroxyacid dehydrogenase
MRGDEMTGPVAFIGVGNMGRPMVENLLAGGVPVRGYDNHPERVEAAGAEVAAGPGSAVTPGGVTISMVPDDRALEQVALADDGVLARIGDGVHLSMSTVSAELSEGLEARYAERGATFLAATVLGRPDVAKAARLTVFLAGADAGKRRVWPLLELMAERIHDFGPRASLANVAKVGANFMIMSAIEAMAEAAALVERHGIDRAAFLRTMAETPLFSGKVYAGYGAMIGEHRYRPALFRAPLGLKDARLVVETARAVGAAVPIAETVCRHLHAAVESGWAEDDWAVLGRVLSQDGETA